MSGAVNASQDIVIGKGLLTGSAAVNFSSEYALSVWNVGCYNSIGLNGAEVCDNGDIQPAYATVDVNVRYTSPYGRWYLEGYGTNVTGTTYATFVRRQGADGVSGYAFNAPLQAGLRMGAAVLKRSGSTARSPAGTVVNCCGRAEGRVLSWLIWNIVFLGCAANR